MTGQPCAMRRSGPVPAPQTKQEPAGREPTAEEPAGREPAEKEKVFVSVVVYARDEPDALAAFIARIGPWLDRHFALYEIVVVDDASRIDPLPMVADAAQAYSVPVVSIRLSRRHGVEAGIKAGLDRAMGDWVFELESPGIDFDLDLLIEMYRIGARGNDVVTASGNRGPLRSRLFYRLVNHYADLDTPLRTERLRLTSRRTLNSMLAMREKVRYRKALYAVLGHRHQHLHYRPIRTAQSRRTRRIDRETSSLAFDILLSFSGFGLRLAHRLSLAFGAFSVGAILYAIGIYAFKSDVIQGWTTLTILISGGFTGIFLILGILGEYLARILVEVRARPMYAIRDTVVVNPPGLRDDGEQTAPAFLRHQLNPRHEPNLRPEPDRSAPPNLRPEPDRSTTPDPRR